jgi:hypothetical protein
VKIGSHVLENIFCAGTYQKILALIAKPALDKAEIRFLTKVIKIDSSERKVALVTENGEKYHFDEVVVTTPLGWLKRNQDAFVPPLPPRLSQAIDSIGYGCLEKVCHRWGNRDPYLKLANVLMNYKIQYINRHLIGLHQFPSRILAR